jgi:transposase
LFAKSQTRRLEKYIHKRRSWLFAETQQGAPASANLYSLVRCAEVNGLKPYPYLLHLFEELPKASTTEALEVLLRWNVKPLLKPQRESVRINCNTDTR